MVNNQVQDETGEADAEDSALYNLLDVDNDDEAIERIHSLSFRGKRVEQRDQTDINLYKVDGVAARQITFTADAIIHVGLKLYYVLSKKTLELPPCELHYIWIALDVDRNFDVGSDSGSDDDEGEDVSAGAAAASVVLDA